MFTVAAERPRGPEISKLYSLFIRLCVRIPPVEKKLYVFVCQMFAHHSYPEFDQKLRELRAVPLMHSIRQFILDLDELEYIEFLYPSDPDFAQELDERAGEAGAILESLRDIEATLRGLDSGKIKIQ